MRVFLSLVLVITVGIDVGHAARQKMLASLERFGVEEFIFAMREDGKDGHWYANFSYLAPEPHRPIYGQIPTTPPYSHT